MVGEGINEDNLFETAKFLIGPCSCKVKEQIPGFDLLMSVAWEKHLGSAVVKDFELPPLVGITSIKLPPPKPGAFQKLVAEVNEAMTLDQDAQEQEPPAAPKESDQRGWPGNRATGGRSLAVCSPPASAGPLLVFGSASMEGVSAASPTSEQPAPVQQEASTLANNTWIGVAVGIGAIVLMYVFTRTRSTRGS
jgi:hypothetical protein